MRPVLSLALVLAFADSASAAAFTIASIPGTANIFAAGEASTAGMDPGGGGGGTLPPFVSFTAGAGHVLTMTSVTGFTDCCSSGSPATPPDGGGGATNIPAFSGVSGAQAPTQMYLVGLFTDGTDHDSGEPATLNFNGNTNFATLTPLLWQQFWIGDGLTGSGSGTQQTFNVPSTATRLYLGFSDAFAFNGNAGFYNDNTGALAASFNITDVDAAVPEPATIALLGTGVGLIASKRRKRR